MDISADMAYSREMHHMEESRASQLALVLCLL